MAVTRKIVYSTVDEYLAGQPESKRIKLSQLRETIKKAAPGAEELISYQMPAFRQHGMLAYYAAFKEHYGLYIMSNILKAFKEQAVAYQMGKATLRFEYDKPLPKRLVSAIIKHGVKLNTEKALLKKKQGPVRTKK